MKLYYIANARLPTEKAHGIQIAKMCEAFAAHGVEVAVIVPRRKTISQTMQEFYGLSRPVTLVRLPIISLYTAGRIGFALASASFMVGCLLYLAWRALRGEEFRLYTVDMDTFSFAPLRLLGRPCIIEVHNKLPATVLTRFFFGGKTAVVAINAQVREALHHTFGLSEKRILTEPNGVDMKAFARDVSVSAARHTLGLPAGRSALYVGRIYAWKELGILADAAARLEGTVLYLVGGTKEEFVRVTGRATVPDSLRFVPEVAPMDVPLWLAAADVLLVLGSRRNESSYRYTAPMKVFEYMAARRPIVASATPALTGIIAPDEVLWYEPDNATDLAQKIAEAAGEEGVARAKRAFARVGKHDWSARARRILSFFSHA